MFFSIERIQRGLKSYGIRRMSPITSLDFSQPFLAIYIVVLLAYNVRYKRAKRRKMKLTDNEKQELTG
jgi:hypothetical protein